MEKVTNIEASEQEILDLINKTYGTNIDSLVAMEEIGNHYIVLSVDNSDTSDYDQAAINDFVNTGFKHYMLNTLLEDMCYKGIIEEGGYVIDCTW